MTIRKSAGCSENISAGRGFVSLAGSKGECEAKLEELKIDLLVLDVMLPDGSGLDLCRILRERMPQLTFSRPTLP